MHARIRSAISTAAVAAAALFIATPGAVATQSQPVLAGAQNTENFETLIVNTGKVSLNDCLAVNPAHDAGLVACGRYGLAGLGTSSGIGVYGTSGTGDGVFGRNSGLFGIGVHGQSAGAGSAVAGEATANGVGVWGTSASAIGVKGQGGPTGVFGSGTTTGVQGSASSGGTGVLGYNGGSTGIGVHGKTGGTGAGVFGEATANGVGVVAKSTGGTGVIAQSDASGGTAVNATATNGTGAIAVRGTTDSGWAGYFTAPDSTGIGVHASGGRYGVRGFTDTGTGVYGANFGATGIGVYGQTGGSGSAVYGEATASGVAVFGKSTTNGTALRGDSASGTALQVNGKAKFSRSGLLTLAASAASITKTGVPLTSASYVLATLQTNTAGLFIQGAVPNPAGSSITIYFSKTAPAGTRVAWFVVA
jgi:hypothetical protein